MKLPKGVFVCWEDEGDDKFLMSFLSPDDIPDDMDGVVVGRYELVEVKKLKVGKTLE